MLVLMTPEQKHALREWSRQIGEGGGGVILRITASELARLFPLQPNVKIRAAEWDFVRNEMSLYLSSPDIDASRVDGVLPLTIGMSSWAKEAGDLLDTIRSMSGKY